LWIWHADRCTDMLLHIGAVVHPDQWGRPGWRNLWASWYGAANKTAEGWSSAR
jgi:hypothetical protein